MGDLIHISKLSFNNLTASNPEKQGDADPNLNFFVSNDYNIIKTNKSAFISRLYQTVEDPRCNTLQWDSEGKSFLITDYDRFEKYTLPNCFNNSSVTSFIRQLNLYGFKRTSDGRKLRGTAPNNFSSFAHQNFVQGQPHLIAKIKRQPRASKRGVFLLYPNEPTNSTPPVATKPPPAMHPQIETETLTLPSSLRSAQMQSSLNIQRRDHPSRAQPETWVNGTQKNYTFQNSSSSSEGDVIYNQPPPTKIDHLLSYNNDHPTSSTSRPFSFVPEAEIEQLTMTGRYRLQPPSFPLPEYLNPPISSSQNRISSSISNILNHDTPATSQRPENRNRQNYSQSYHEDYYLHN